MISYKKHDWLYTYLHIFDNNDKNNNNDNNNNNTNNSFYRKKNIFSIIIVMYCYNLIHSCKDNNEGIKKEKSMTFFYIFIL